MGWIDQDWEKEYDLDAMYAQERQSLLEQEYFEHEQKLLNKIKKHENKRNITPLRCDIEKRIKHGRHSFTKSLSRRRGKRT